MCGAWGLGLGFSLEGWFLGFRAWGLGFAVWKTDALKDARVMEVYKRIIEVPLQDYVEAGTENL